MVPSKLIKTKKKQKKTRILGILLEKVIRKVANVQIFAHELPVSLIKNSLILQSLPEFIFIQPKQNHSLHLSHLIVLFFYVPRLSCFDDRYQ